MKPTSLLPAPRNLAPLTVAARAAMGATPLLALAALLAAGLACTNRPSYSYTDVSVVVDPAVTKDQLVQIISCEMRVTGAETSDVVGLRCPMTKVMTNIGSLQWTSKTTTGSLQFQVTVFDANHDPLGDGTSDPVALAPGAEHSTTVIVRWLSPPVGNDAGGGDAATDGGTGDDADAADNDAGDGGAADGSEDGSDTAPDTGTD